MTRKEAEADAKELNKRDPQWFCPLINAMCRKDCINFMPAMVESDEHTPMQLHSIDADDFYIDGFVCSNGMFLGV